MTRTTHTFATMEVSHGAYREIREKLVAAGYEHALHRSDRDYPELLDMHGIALAEAPMPVAMTEAAKKICDCDQRKNPDLSAHASDCAAQQLKQSHESLLQLMADSRYRALLDDLILHPVHANHPWTDPLDFVVAVEGCQRCEAFFSLPARVVEILQQVRP